MIDIKTPSIIEKGWGHEVVICNNNNYCSKILCFKRNAKISMHFHMIKDETWYVKDGDFNILWIDPESAKKHTRNISKDMIIHIPPGFMHQLECISESGSIFEVSTQHFDSDSYRIIPGDSQKK